LNYKEESIKFSKLLRKFKKREKGKEEPGSKEEITVIPEI